MSVSMSGGAGPTGPTALAFAGQERLFDACEARWQLPDAHVQIPRMICLEDHEPGDHEGEDAIWQERGETGDELVHEGGELGDVRLLSRIGVETNGTPPSAGATRRYRRFSART